MDNVQDAPKAFEWVTDLADTIIVTQDNISSDYTNGPRVKTWTMR